MNSEDIARINSSNSSNSSNNNGGDTDYYRIDPEWTMVQDIIESKSYNYSQGNILKVAFTLNSGRHSGTDIIRDLNKLIWFAKREIKRLESKKSKI